MRITLTKLLLFLTLSYGLVHGQTGGGQGTGGGPGGGGGTGAFTSTGVGTGYQDVTEIAAPSNPGAGVDRLYTNSTTHQFACLTSSGGSCSPSGTPAFSAITTGTNTTATMTVGSGATLNIASGAVIDFSAIGTGTFKTPQAAGFTASATITFGLDTTANLFHFFTNTADSINAVTTSTSTTTTQPLFATAVAGIYNPRAIAIGDLPAAVVSTGQTNVYGAFLQDFTSGTMEVPEAAGFTTNVNSTIGLDTTANLMHLWNNSADSLVHTTGTSAFGANTSIFTTTTALGQFLALKNTTAAVVGTSQGSPVFSLCGTAFHGSASVEDCATLSELPGNGNDAAITVNAGHTGTSTGTVTWQFPGPVAAGANGGVAGGVILPQGTAIGHSATTSVVVEAPAAVTSYELILPGTSATGVVHRSNAANVDTESISAVVNADITSMSEDKLTGAAAAATLTEVGAGDVITRAGVETGNLTAPQVFTDTNSTNNNTNIGQIVGVTGTSTGGIAQLLFDASGTGDIWRAYSGGSVAAGVYTVGTKEASLSSAGALCLGACPTGLTFGTGYPILGVEGTQTTGIAAGTSGFVMDSTAHAPVQWNNGVNVGATAALGATETFTAVQTFSPSARTSGVAPYFQITTPTDTGVTAATEGQGLLFATATRTWATTGTVALQREVNFQGPTYASASASQTFTDAFTLYATPPIAGTNAIFTRDHTLGIVDATSAASAITGAVVVAQTLGTAATSVGIGGGNVNAGANLTAASQTITGTAAGSPGLVDKTIGITTAAMGAQSTATCTNVTNMTWSIAANKNYVMHCNLPMTFAASATVAFCIGGPGTPTSHTINAVGSIGVAGAYDDINLVNSATYGTKTTASGAVGASTQVILLDAVIRNGATASGTALTLQTAANGTNNITVLADASCSLEQEN